MLVIQSHSSGFPILFANKILFIAKIKLSTLMIMMMSEMYLVRMWQNIKFTSFLCQRKIYTSSHLLKYQVVYFLCQGKNLHIKFITLLSVVNFLNKSTYLLIKFLIFVWNTIFPLPSQLRRRNKKIYVYTFINQEGLVMAKLKELRRSGNYML